MDWLGWQHSRLTICSDFGWVWQILNLKETRVVYGWVATGAKFGGCWLVSLSKGQCTVWEINKVILLLKRPSMDLEISELLCWVPTSGIATRKLKTHVTFGVITFWFTSRGGFSPSWSFQRAATTKCKVCTSLLWCKAFGADCWNELSNLETKFQPPNTRENWQSKTAVIKLLLNSKDFQQSVSIWRLLQLQDTACWEKTHPVGALLHS